MSPDPAGLSAPFIRRPVATSLMAAALLVVGAVCYSLLPVSALPQVDTPTVIVGASLAGAGPETMASSVAMPLERQLSQIPGVTEMTSSSTLGQTVVVVQFELSRNVDGAAQDVQQAITAASGQLPQNLNEAPSLFKVNPADAPILLLIMRSDTLPLSAVTDVFDNVVLGEISRIPGVGQVNYGGVQKPAVRIRIDPRKAASLGLQLEDIRAAVVANSVNAPKGQFSGPDRNVILYANDQVLEAGPWNDLIVGYKAGAPIRVRDVGEAVAGVENDQTMVYVTPGAGRDADPTLKPGAAVAVLVGKQPGANMMRTAQAVKAALADVQAKIPPGVELHLVQDKTQTVRAAVRDVQATLLITVGLVTAVIFLFLGDLRATVIPAAVIPLSLLATAAVMLPAGFSLDNLSLMALTIAVGFVVDDAVVVVEAIWRRIEHGQAPFAAALAGAREIGFTVMAISVSLVAVFTPLMFMTGLVGRILREFALTLGVAVMLSMALSLTVTPMLCGRFLRPPRGAGARMARAFARIDRAYASALDRVMRRKGVTLALFAATLALAVGLYATAKTGFFPLQDTGFVSGIMVGAQDSSFALTRAKAEQASRLIAADPDVSEVNAVIGGDVSHAFLDVTLTPQDHGRTASAAQVIDRLRPRLEELVGANVFLRPSQDIQVGGRAGRAQFLYALADEDLAELNLWAPRLVAALQKQPELKDVSSDQADAAPAATLVIDRNAAGRFGVSPADIDAAIYNQIGQRQVSLNFSQVNFYKVVMEGPPGLQVSPALLDSIYIAAPRTGRLVPLSLVAHVDMSQRHSTSISHQGQFPAVNLSFNLAPGVSLDRAVAAVARARADLGAPVTLEGGFQGTAAAYQKSLASMPILIVAALLSVYIILGVLYESYVHPLTILSTLPSAGVGALLALRLAGHDLDVIGIIAIILLIGIVKKNGVMVVDVALKLERDGLSAEQAVLAACRQRLRPILMTTACAFLGGVPMILTHGTGSEFRQPLGWAIVGGLLVSQALTLFSTPVVYVCLGRLRRADAAFPWGSPSRAPDIS